MRNLKIFVLTVFLTLTLLVTGCNLFPENRTRPAPVRPTPTPAPAPRTQQTPAPTKRIPGTTSLSEADLLKRISACEKATKAGNWKKANSEGNTLGADMARYRPDAPDGQSLRDMTRFDAIYTKLQANLKIRNKAGTLKDLKNLRDAMKDLNKNPQ